MSLSTRGVRTERYAFVCERCPRLAVALAADRQGYPEHVARPLGARGPASARLLIVGLAPGHRGANRTGLIFAGDSSGQTLFRGLAAAGLASSADPFSARLLNTRLTNAVKCWPPGNRPTIEERRHCEPYLAAELSTLWQPQVRRPRAVLCLGHLAYDALLRTSLLSKFAAAPAFAHGLEHWLQPTFWLGASYHPSRQNLNTGRLTQHALDLVLLRAAEVLRLTAPVYSGDEQTGT